MREPLFTLQKMAQEPLFKWKPTRTCHSSTCHSSVCLNFLSDSKGTNKHSTPRFRSRNVVVLFFLPPFNKIDLSAFKALSTLMLFQKYAFSLSSKKHRSIRVHTTVLMCFRLSTLKRSKTIELHVVT